jgi:hypothetical protein
MSPKAIQVSHAGDYRLDLTFEDGLRATVDFKQRVLSRRGVWLPLHEVDYFKQARINADLQTIAWPNGADICPDVLYGLASGKVLPDARTQDSAATV